jgi:hypothetical protein
VIDAHCCEDGSHATPCDGSHGAAALHVAPDAPSAVHEPLDVVNPPSPTIVVSLQKKPVAHGAEALHGSPDSPRPAQIDPPSLALVTHVRPTSHGVDPLHAAPSCAAGLFAQRPHAPALDDVTRQNADVHCESSMQAVPPLSDPGVGAHAGSGTLAAKSLQLCARSAVAQSDAPLGVRLVPVACKSAKQACFCCPAHVV